MHCLLSEQVEVFTSGSRFSSIEAIGELIEISLKMTAPIKPMRSFLISDLNWDPLTKVKSGPNGTWFRSMNGDCNFASAV